jgi:hypothetical protein
LKAKGRIQWTSCISMLCLLCALILLALLIAKLDISKECGGCDRNCNGDAVAEISKTFYCRHNCGCRPQFTTISQVLLFSMLMNTRYTHQGVC